MAELIGRLCTKIAGREGNRKVVIVDVLEGNYVLIDGQSKRRRCNISHLEFTDKLLKIKKNASTEEVRTALEKENIKITYTKKDKEKKLRPVKQRNSKPIKQNDRQKPTKVSGVPGNKPKAKQS